MKQIKIRYSLKYSFPVLLLFSFLLITGCQDADSVEDTTSAIKERTFTLTASMPADDAPSGPSTRLIASQETGSKNIVLKWRKGDKIQLYFKNEKGNFVTTETQVKNISTDGRDAEFDVLVPDEVTGDFDLYGVHGAESKAINKTILLDARPSNLDQLGNISIPIYFKKENLSSGSTDTKVSFKHYGALQVLTFKNTENKRIALEAPYIKPKDDKKWYYDVYEDSQPVYDIVSGEVLMKKVDFSSSTSVSSAQISYSDNLQLAQWIVPNAIEPPAVNLSMNIDGVEEATTKGKEASSGALKVGRAYHLYAMWDGETLDFTGETAVQTYNMTMTTSKTVGSTISLSIRVSHEYSGDVWIDWNNNGAKDDGEAVVKSYYSQTYEVISDSITIYGEVTYLTCNYQSITSLDVTKNTALTELRCTENSIATLDVTKNTALTYLDCNRNTLTSLDLTKNTALTDLICYGNSFTSLDLMKNTALTHLSCGSNSKLTKLDVTKNKALTYLNCGASPLYELDITNNTALTHLSCPNNKLSELDVTNNTALTLLSCGNNDFEELIVSNNTALTELYCGNNNKLTSLDVSNNTALTSLGCSANGFKELNVTYNTALVKLECGSNKLTELDVSKCTALTSLNCYSNGLEALNVGYNIALTKLRCDVNAISGLAMDNLINSLPTRPESSKGSIRIIDIDYHREKNICTKEQVAIANDRGWDVISSPETAYPGS